MLSRLHTKLLIASMLISVSTFAENINQTDRCRKMYETAKTIMVARQREMPLPEIMEMAGDSTLLKNLILDAYEIPAYHSENNKTNAISKFANRAAALCYKSNK